MPAEGARSLAHRRLAGKFDVKRPWTRVPAGRLGLAYSAERAGKGHPEHLWRVATFMADLGRPATALAFFEGQEALTRDLDMAEGLAKALCGQALALCAIDRPSEARLVLEEASEIAGSHGFGAIAKEVEAARLRVKSA